MNLLHKMVGGDVNCSHVSLAEFDKDYYLSTMVSKLLNIDDDVVDGKTLENTGRFKSIISGNIISVRQIYREVMSFAPYATCLFSCNRLPRIMDNTSGLYRRMILIELNHKIAKPDPLFMNKVTEQDMEYLLFKSVEGIKLAIEEGRFRISTSEEELLNLFRRRQSPINEWLYENDMRISDFHEKDCLPLYNQYVEWCNLNGYNKLMTNFSFKESICALYDLELDRVQKEQGIKQVFIKRGMFDPMYKPF
jgi:putative DNA primase/helicase